MGHDHLDTDEYNTEFDPFFYEDEFKKAAKPEIKKSKENPEVISDAKEIVTQDEEYEVKKIVRMHEKQTIIVQDEEFQITKKA